MAYLSYDSFRQFFDLQVRECFKKLSLFQEYNLKMSFSYFKSQMGRNLVKLDGFEYQLNRKKDSISYWRCCKVRTSNKCRAVLHIRDKKIIFHNDCHNHPPNIARIEAKITMDAIKSKARNTMETPSQVLSSFDVNTLFIL